MKKTVLVLAILGALASGALGMIWQQQVDEIKGSGVDKFLESVDKGKSDAELEKDFGSKYKELKDLAAEYTRAKKAPIMLLIACPLALVAGFLAFRGFGYYAAGIFIVIGVVPPIFLIKALVPTSFLLVSGGLCFVIGNPKKKKKKKQHDEEEDEEEDEDEEEEEQPRLKKNKGKKAAHDEEEEEEEPEDDAPRKRKKKQIEEVDEIEEEDVVEVEAEVEEVEEVEDEEPEEVAPKKIVRKPAAIPENALRIKIHCPECDAPLMIINPVPGRKMTCPKCKNPFPISKIAVQKALAARRAAEEEEQIVEDAEVEEVDEVEEIEVEEIEEEEEEDAPRPRKKPGKKRR